MFSEHFVIQPNINEKHFHLDAPNNTILLHFLTTGDRKRE